MIGKEEQRDGGRLFLLFVTLTIVCYNGLKHKEEICEKVEL